jgi:hypothetical protein
MSDRPSGVGLNAEPDDYAARYDHMVAVGVGPLLTRFLVAVIGSSLVIGLILALVSG